MKPFIFLFCLVYFFSCSNADKFRPELQSKIDKLRNEKELGYNDSASVSYLKDSCSKDELLTLTTNKTPIIRILAYRAIVNRNEENFFTILKNHLSDTAKITWWYYDDAADEFTISDLMIRKAEKKLTRQQKDTLIDLILNEHIYLGTAKWIMEDIEPNEKYYAIIKEQAEIKSDNCHDLGLTLAVAKFKKPEDIPFIQSKFSGLSDNSYCNDNIFKGIEIFPDSSFFMILQQYFNNNIRKQKQSSYSDLEIYCKAVARYKTKDAFNILQALTEKSTYPDDWYLPDNKEYVFKAIYEYNCDLYKKLYDHLKPQMDKDIFDNIDFSFKDRPSTW
ncbi:hypothetical protein [Ferruginibacter profundus]